jgi:hypothetical protein
MELSKSTFEESDILYYPLPTIYNIVEILFRVIVILILLKSFVYLSTIEYIQLSSHN